MKTTSTCWHCGGEVAAAEDICPSCGKVQPPPPAKERADKFAILGLAPSFDEALGSGMPLGDVKSLVDHILSNGGASKRQKEKR